MAYNLQDYSLLESLRGIRLILDKSRSHWLNRADATSIVNSANNLWISTAQLTWFAEGLFLYPAGFLTDSFSWGPFDVRKTREEPPLHSLVRKLTFHAMNDRGDRRIRKLYCRRTYSTGLSFQLVHYRCFIDDGSDDTSDDSESLTHTEGNRDGNNRNEAVGDNRNRDEEVASGSEDTAQTDYSDPNKCQFMSQFDEEARSPFVNKYKTISHSGEVNRIRELPQNSNIVATYTDSPDVLILDVETQPNLHAVLGAANSCLDLILTGHQGNAEFALGMSPTVLSRGKDKSVVLWSIQDHITTVGKDSKSSGSIIKQTGEGSGKNESPSVGSRGLHHGREDTVEDVAFSPSAQVFCSVGDGCCLILWDARTGTNTVMKVEKAHDAESDLHCVDWNPHDDNLIHTGSADNTVRFSNGVGSPIYKFEGHKAAVVCVQWSPDKSSVFGSCAEDGLLNIWDHDRIWRMSDLIYRPEEEVLTELEKFKSHVMACASKP